MTGELVSWLCRALDEIEAVARASAMDGEGVWLHDCPHDADEQQRAPSHELCCQVGGDIRIYDEGGHGVEDAAHIALHDPRAVLARVTAEREVITGWRDAMDIPDGHGGPMIEAALSSALRVLAWGHRHDFPGWRDEWAPEGVKTGA